MRRVESYEQIRSFMGQIRSLKKGFVTNFYWNENKHPHWIDKGELFFDDYSDCVILTHMNDSFCNMFFMATNYEAVVSALHLCHVDSDVIIDLVCKGDGQEERKLFREIGFEDYRSLFRMMHLGMMDSSNWTKEKSVDYGEVEDAIEIFEIFQRDFDPLCEQLPSISEIEDFAKRKQILVLKDGEQLCGFIIFEITGATWYLRYWYTSPAYRDKGVGAKLIKTSLLLGQDTKRQLFWVISDNVNAIKRYEHYGFKRENMNDYVIIKRR